MVKCFEQSLEESLVEIPNTFQEKSLCKSLNEFAEIFAKIPEGIQRGFFFFFEKYQEVFHEEFREECPDKTSGGIVGEIPEGIPPIEGRIPLNPKEITA